MKDFILVVKEGVTAHYIKMSNDFCVNVYEDDGYVYVNFEDKRDDTIYITISFSIHGYVNGKNLIDFPVKTQRYIINVLREYIWTDIDKFLADKKDEDYYALYPLSDSQIFQCDEFIDRCEAFYDKVIDNLDPHLLSPEQIQKD